MPKHITIHITCFIFFVVFTSCNQSGKERSDALEDTCTIHQEDSLHASIPCQLVSIKSMGRRIDLNWKDTLPMEATSYEKNTGRSQKISYKYDGLGRLQNITLNPPGNALVYEYDDGKLVKITGSGFVETRHFTYDDAGRIKKQESHYQSFSYTYNKDNVPVKVDVYGEKQTHEQSVRLEYGHVHNPFRKLGTLLNETELMYGYAVGTMPYLPTRAIITYKSTTSYKVNGQRKQAGEKDTSLFQFNSNAQNYPVKMDYDTLVYDCCVD